MEAQKFETTKEQQRLHSLIAMLETQLSEKQRDVDKVGCEKCEEDTLKNCSCELVGIVVSQERWQLHQEQSRLKAQRCAFENERETSLQRTQDDRDQLQQAKVDDGICAYTYILFLCNTIPVYISFCLCPTARRSSSKNSRPFSLSAI